MNLYSLLENFCIYCELLSASRWKTTVRSSLWLVYNDLWPHERRLTITRHFIRNSNVSPPSFRQSLSRWYDTNKNYINPHGCFLICNRTVVSAPLQCRSNYATLPLFAQFYHVPRRISASHYTCYFPSHFIASSTSICNTALRKNFNLFSSFFIYKPAVPNLRNWELRWYIFWLFICTAWTEDHRFCASSQCLILMPH